MSRIKCPNCGSTAQVDLVWEDRSSYDTKKTKEFICGCGCNFEVIFKAVEVNILKDETAPCSIIGAGGEVWTGSMPAWD